MHRISSIITHRLHYFLCLPKYNVCFSFDQLRIKMHLSSSDFTPAYSVVMVGKHFIIYVFFVHFFVLFVLTVTLLWHVLFDSIRLYVFPITKFYSSINCRFFYFFQRSYIINTQRQRFHPSFDNIRIVHFHKYDEKVI